VRRKNTFERKPQQMQEKKQTIIEHVLNFSIAYLLLLILQTPKTHIEQKFTMKKKMEKLRVQIPRSWLMQAIIYELARIKEQGQIQQQQPKKKKNQKTFHYPRFIPHGVIFAYAT